MPQSDERVNGRKEVQREDKICRKGVGMKHITHCF